MHDAASAIYDHAQKYLDTDEARTFKRELSAAGQSVVGLPVGLYHAAVDPETEEESARFGRGFESRIGPTGRLLDRTVVQPLVNAIEDYKNGKGTDTASAREKMEEACCRYLETGLGQRK